MDKSIRIYGIVVDSEGKLFCCRENTTDELTGKKPKWRLPSASSSGLLISSLSFSLNKITGTSPNIASLLAILEFQDSGTTSLYFEVKNVDDFKTVVASPSDDIECSFIHPIHDEDIWGIPNFNLYQDIVDRISKPQPPIYISHVRNGGLRTASPS